MKCAIQPKNLYKYYKQTIISHYQRFHGSTSMICIERTKHYYNVGMLFRTICHMPFEHFTENKMTIIIRTSNELGSMKRWKCFAGFFHTGSVSAGFFLA